MVQYKTMCTWSKDLTGIDLQCLAEMVHCKT